MNQVRHSILALALSACLPSSATAQSFPHRLPGWIAQPLKSSSPQAASRSTDPDWARVIRLRAGDRFMVLADGSRTPQERTFVDADGTAITLLNLSAPGLSADARQALGDAVLFHRADVVDVLSGREFRFGALELKPSGVMFAGVRAADIEDVIERVARSEVISITTRARRKGSGKAAGIGAGIGAVAGYLSLMGALSAQHVEHKELVRFMGYGFFWMPAAGGVIGYSASLREVRGSVVYRRKLPSPLW